MVMKPLWTPEDMTIGKFYGHTGQITAITVGSLQIGNKDQETDWLFTGAEDCSVRRWDIRNIAPCPITGKPVHYSSP